MKADSHKGKNSDENFLIRFYYENFYFFATMVVGSESCTVALYLCAKSKVFGECMPFVILTGILCLIMSTKMLINVFQWYSLPHFKHIIGMVEFRGY